MRHRPRPVLNAVVTIAVVAVASCSSSGSDGGNDAFDPSARRLPGAEAREYCGLVGEYYERLDEFVADVQEQLGSDATQAALDRRYIGFVRENQPLFEELVTAAPDVIADEAATQAQAFADAARVGDLAPLETPAARTAESRTVAYEAEECGIVRE